MALHPYETLLNRIQRLQHYDATSSTRFEIYRLYAYERRNPIVDALTADLARGYLSSTVRTTFTEWVTTEPCTNALIHTIISICEEMDNEEIQP